jgi:hypothetical protein
MMDADDFRRHAAECERLAKITQDPKIKKELLALAQSWLESEPWEQAPSQPVVLSKPDGSATTL